MLGIHMEVQSIMPRGENNRGGGRHSGKSENRGGGQSGSNRSEAAKKGWETRRRNMKSKSK